MELAKIKIAMAGHTNTGKTTLIRTLMKTTVGKVDDSPNVTKKGQAYFYDGIQAYFIDTPGFCHASVYNMYLDAKQEDPNFQLPKNWDEKISVDRDATESIKESNVVLYVGMLDVVPDDSYLEEIYAVKNIQPKVIGVLNKARKQFKSSGKETMEHRIALWKQVFKEQGIENIIVFDAHWDKPSKIERIYEAIFKVLSSEEKSLFSKGLEQFKKRQKEILTQAITLLANSIDELQDIKVSTKKFNYSDDKAKKRISRQVQG